jgi:hypothetical protein
VLSWFHASLKPGGLLFLGQCEDIGDLGDRFAPVDSKIKAFRRIEAKLRIKTTPELISYAAHWLAHQPVQGPA